MNELSSKVTALEVKNTRLETQVENLIETLGKGENKAAPKESVDNNKSVKCRHNDKAICMRSETCQYIHSKFVCSIFSRFGECENEITCPKRHPTGICNKWRRGLCEKDMECFYRHPEGEEGSISRKRTLSNQINSQINKTPKTLENFQTNQEDHFLFQQMMDLEKKYQNLEETRKEKKEEKREDFQLDG